MKLIRWKRVFVVLVLAAGSLGPGNANSATLANLPEESGIWRQRMAPNAIGPSHEQRLVERLRRITGFCELQFSAGGSLSIGIASAVSGGAETARTVLQQALHSGLIFVIEDHSGSEAVHFGQVEPFWLKRTEPPSEVEIYRIRLDFKDFREMEASQIVRETFDEGFTLLHELLHGLGYADAFVESEVGPCEQIVNQARAELGLPLREQYLAEAIPVTDQFTTLRLRFRSRPSQPGGRSKSYYLFFVVKDSLESLRDLGDAARMTRARQRANPDKRVSAKVSLAPPAHADPASNSAPD